MRHIEKCDISEQTSCFFMMTRIRWFSIPLFIAILCVLIDNCMTLYNISDSLLPWQNFKAELSLVENIRLYFTFPLIALNIYLGYRCMANELDMRIVELNSDLNQLFTEAIRAKVRAVIDRHL